MNDLHYTRETHLDVPAETAFAWHERPGAFERLAPPWEAVRVLARRGTIRDGDRLVLGLKLGPLSVRWVAEHGDYVAGRSFRDVQRKGPFARWEHTHGFEPVGRDRCRLSDSVVYRLPLGALGRLLGGRNVRRRLDRLFDYRHRQTSLDLACHASFQDRPRRRVALTGASGLIGSALEALLTTGGHEVIRLSRAATPSDGPAVSWDAARGVVDPGRLDGVDAVVHLAGENLATGRWTRAKMHRIRESRVRGTASLVASLARVEPRPRVLVCASAIGYYGDRGSETLDEGAGPGSGFLADVVGAWESAAVEAEALGIRVVRARLGVVLTPRGGALAKMLSPFRVGLGGPVGHGRQMMSWIGLDDAITAIHHALMCDDLSGALNLTAPAPVSSRAFARELGRVLRRPAFAPLPAPVARLAFGKMADELLLSSTHAVPTRLLRSGFVFRDPRLGDALARMLGHCAREPS